MNIFKNPRFVSGVISVAIVISLFGGTALAQASTLGSVQVEAIINLLMAFGADPATVANVQAVLENQSTTTQAVSLPSTSDSSVVSPDISQASSSCSVLDNNFQFGENDESTNGDVSELQAFLGKDNSIYQGPVTGYYGTSTLQAVQRWQAAHGIVSSGDSESTGFGRVGPRTRQEMNKEMEKKCEQEREGLQNSSGENSGEHSSDSATSTSHESESGD